MPSSGPKAQGKSITRLGLIGGLLWNFRWRPLLCELARHIRRDFYRVPDKLSLQIDSALVC